MLILIIYHTPPELLGLRQKLKELKQFGFNSESKI